MRIIAGEFRGRKLLPPESDTTRPVTDRVKQSLFDILAPRLEGAAVFDCFAGTGSMGLECLSRRAASAKFFEADRSAINRLKKNIATLAVADRSSVVTGDIFGWKGEGMANLIFLDPPYRFLREQSQALQQLAERLAGKHLAVDGLLIFRHDISDILPLPSLKIVDQRNYGSMSVELLQRIEV